MMAINTKPRAERGSKTNNSFKVQAAREWLRQWGKYDKPFEFRMAVTELNKK